tara:strand:- start:661 stop:924 length:264 start_codon:yes stop_codon:yes gene_type:complete
MKRPKDILSHPWHIQEYINDLERKNSSLHSVMRCYVKEIDQFYKDTGYCDNTNQFGIRKDYKRGDGWDFKTPSQMIKDWMKWKRNNA